VQRPGSRRNAAGISSEGGEPNAERIITQCRPVTQHRGTPGRTPCPPSPRSPDPTRAARTAETESPASLPAARDTAGPGVERELGSVSGQRLGRVAPGRHAPHETGPRTRLARGFAADGNRRLDTAAEISTAIPLNPGLVRRSLKLLGRRVLLVAGRGNAGTPAHPQQDGQREYPALQRRSAFPISPRPLFPLYFVWIFQVPARDWPRPRALCTSTVTRRTIKRVSILPLNGYGARAAEKAKRRVGDDGDGRRGPLCRIAPNVGRGKSRPLTR